MPKCYPRGLIEVNMVLIKMRFTQIGLVLNIVIEPIYPQYHVVCVCNLASRKCNLTKLLGGDITT